MGAAAGLPARETRPGRHQVRQALERLGLVSWGGGGGLDQNDFADSEELPVLKIYKLVILW